MIAARRKLEQAAIAKNAAEQGVVQTTSAEQEAQAAYDEHARTQEPLARVAGRMTEEQKLKVSSRTGQLAGTLTIEEASQATFQDQRTRALAMQAQADALEKEISRRQSEVVAMYPEGAGVARAMAIEQPRTLEMRTAVTGIGQAALARGRIDEFDQLLQRRKTAWDAVVAATVEAEAKLL